MHFNGNFTALFPAGKFAWPHKLLRTDLHWYLHFQIIRIFLSLPQLTSTQGSLSNLLFFLKNISFSFNFILFTKFFKFLRISIFLTIFQFLKKSWETIWDVVKQKSCLVDRREWQSCWACICSEGIYRACSCFPTWGASIPQSQQSNRRLNKASHFQRRTYSPSNPRSTVKTSIFERFCRIYL